LSRRIAVIGASCSGKTTLARSVAGRLGVSHVELDALHHGPNWQAAPRDEFRARVSEALAADGWVADGNYFGKLEELVLERADLVVWLDLPLATIMPRLWRRTSHRIRNRVELWNGNRETWRDVFFSRESLFLWVLTTHRRRRRELPEVLGRYKSVRLRSQQEADAWLEQFANGDG
jgi:adenylate kinase family enzyme